MLLKQPVLRGLDLNLSYKKNKQPAIEVAFADRANQLCQLFLNRLLAGSQNIFASVELGTT